MSGYPAMQAIVDALGGAGTLRGRVRSVVDLERLVGKGLPYRSLVSFAGRYPEEKRKRILALVVARTTLQRRQQSGALSPEESERLERLARLTALSEYVWESREEAQAFLFAEHPLLGAAPVDLARTELGARRVEELLWRLEYGLPA